MPFRFRRSLRLGPLRFNLTANGLSSVSLGRPGATVNIPLARQGGVRTTVGIPGIGLSWSEEAGRPSAGQRRQQQRTGTTRAIPTTEQLVADMHQAFAAGVGHTLWHEHGVGLVAVLMDRNDTPRSLMEQLSCITSADRAELHIRRGRTKADTLHRAQQVLAAARAALDHGVALGIVEEGS